MKINEIITENSQLPVSHTTATPDMRSHTSLDNSSPYAPWRFAAHFLGGANGKDPYEHKPEKEGPNGQSLVTISYSDGDAAILDQAEKEFGITSKRLTPNDSSEDPAVNNKSTHRRVGPIQRVVKVDIEK